jgi:hypothetical protein
MARTAFLTFLLGRLPADAAELVEAGRFAGGRRVFLDQVDPVDGQVELVLAGVGEQHEVLFRAPHVEPGQAAEHTDAVLDVDDVIALVEVGKGGLEPFLAPGLPAVAARALAEDLVLGDDRDPVEEQVGAPARRVRPRDPGPGVHRALFQRRREVGAEHVGRFVEVADLQAVGPQQLAQALGAAERRGGEQHHLLVGLALLDGLDERAEQAGGTTVAFIVAAHALAQDGLPDLAGGRGADGDGVRAGGADGEAAEHHGAAAVDARPGVVDVFEERRRRVGEVAAAERGVVHLDEVVEQRMAGLLGRGFVLDDEREAIVAKCPPDDIERELHLLVERWHQALDAEEGDAVVEILQRLAQLLGRELDLVGEVPQALFRPLDRLVVEVNLARRTEADLLEPLARPLRLRVEELEGVDGVAEEIEAEGLRQARPEDVDDAPAHCERARVLHGVDAGVPADVQLLDQRVANDVDIGRKHLAHALQRLEGDASAGDGLGREHEHVEGDAGGQLVERGRPLHDHQRVGAGGVKGRPLVDGERQDARRPGLTAEEAQIAEEVVGAGPAACDHHRGALLGDRPHGTREGQTAEPHHARALARLYATLELLEAGVDRHESGLAT